MSKICEICGKRSQSGNQVSHSHHKTKRKWHPNLQRVRALVDGGVKRLIVCTSCLQKGKITKP